MPEFASMGGKRDHSGPSELEGSPTRGVESEALLASLVGGSADAIVSVARDGTTLSWNAAAHAMFGTPPSAAIGRSMDAVVDALGDRERRRAAVARVFDEGAVLRYEAERLNGAGEVVIVAVSMSPVRAADGTVTAACVICADITDRRRAENEHARLAAIVRASGDAVFGVDRGGRLTGFNDAARALFGLTDAAVGKPLADGVRPADGEQEAGQHDALERAMAGDVVLYEGRSLRADGTAMLVAITLAPIRALDGSVAGVSAVARDVTAHRRLEDQLQQAQRLEAIGRLAGGVAHDFNNLLTVITGYGGIVAEHLGDGPGAREMEEIRRAARRASELTGQLLAFSRRQRVDPVPLDLSATVKDLMPMLDRLIGEDIRVVVLVEDDIAPILADRNQIEQVILNLAVNGRDAMPHGGTLTIETQTVELAGGQTGTQLDLDPGRYACLTVTDSGEGIAREAIEHLFEPFFTTKEPGKGTGLGLATVHGIVTQAGGQVRVYSERGLGATFKVYLPCAVEHPPGARDAAERGGRSGADGGAETVLVCEDEDALRALLERILAREGYTVVAAATPTEAIELAARHGDEVDVLVTDVIMPVLSGPELAARLGERRELRTLFLSGYTAETIRERGRLPADSAFLEKPFDAPSLLRALRGLLDAPERHGARSR
jgi:two-component system, cell cycle sensor histidine kinase and response regulator CckA